MDFDNLFINLVFLRFISYLYNKQHIMVRIKKLNEILISNGFKKHYLWQFWELNRHWVKISKDSDKQTLILYDGGNGTYGYSTTEEFLESEEFKAIIKEKHFKQFDL